MTKARLANTGNVDAARKLLDAALKGDVPRSRKPTKTEGIESLRPQIEELRRLGYSWAEISTLLKPVGFGNKDTIRYAIDGGKAAKAADRKRAGETSAESDKTNDDPQLDGVVKAPLTGNAAQDRATWET